MTLKDLSAEELASALEQAKADYDGLAARGLSLDITRGKPSTEQLDLADPMLTAVTADDHTDASGADVRNYGGLTGLTELREIFSPLLAAPVDQLTAQGNSSLTLMRDVLLYALVHGRPDSEQPWANGPRKFLCPIPGYDRHFGLTEALGFELISVGMDEHGPKMDEVRAHAADPAVKGIWLVPLYSNPTGVSMSEERVRELLDLETAAPDFTMMWDNAYGLHHLRDVEAAPLDILALAAGSKNPDRPICFASTSKITHAGSGVAFLYSSKTIVDWFLGHLGEGAIGPDKVNQLRHVRFFGSPEGVREHMRKQGEILAPKFDAVIDVLESRLGDDGIASWTNPDGGYFITLTVEPGTATRVVELAAAAGVTLTPAGSTHPYRKDPEDAYIRIAPSMPSPADVEVAAQVLAASVRLAALEKLTA